MNIDKFKHQHNEILESIDTLRRLSREGVTENATDIARAIVAMSSTIKLHLPQKIACFTLRFSAAVTSS